MNWLKKQFETAKVAWSIVVIIATIFGYQLNLTPVQTPPDQRIDLVLQRLNAVQHEIELLRDSHN
jgi:hypothetical protein